MVCDLSKSELKLLFVETVTTSLPVKKNKGKQEEEIGLHNNYKSKNKSLISPESHYNRKAKPNTNTSSTLPAPSTSRIFSKKLQEIYDDSGMTSQCFKLDYRSTNMYGTININSICHY